MGVLYCVTEFKFSSLPGFFSFFFLFRSFCSELVRKKKSNMKLILLFFGLIVVVMAYRPLKRECCHEGNCRDYRGARTTTRSRRTCQAWNSHKVHKHYHITSTKYPNSGLYFNYCRNPDNSPGGAWCYTTDKKIRWEYCDVPQCPKDPYRNMQCRNIYCNDPYCTKLVEGSLVHCAMGKYYVGCGNRHCYYYKGPLKSHWKAYMDFSWFPRC